MLFSFFPFFTPTFLLIALNLAQAAIVTTPASLTACQPAAIKWTGASGPVYLSVIEGKDPGSTPLITFPQQSGSDGSFTWDPVNVKAGTTITFVINDGTGQINFSSQISVHPGSGCDDSTLLGSGISDGTASFPSTAANTSSASGGQASASSTASQGNQSSTTSSHSVNGTTTTTNGTTSSTNAAVPASSLASGAILAGITAALAGMTILSQV